MFLSPDQAARMEWKVAYVMKVRKYTVHLDVIDWLILTVPLSI